MFGTILLSIVTLLHVYVFWRVSSVPFIHQHVPRLILIAIAVVLWAGFYFGRVFGHGRSGTLATMLEIFGMHWMAVLFLIFVCFLSVDIITVFGFILPRLAPSLRGLALIAGGILSAVALFQGMRSPVIQEYEVTVPGLSDSLDGTVIVGLSDTHLGSIIGEKWLERRIAQVQDQKADMIVMLGDVFEGHGPPREAFLTSMKRLSAPMGVWAVNGNHERYGRDGSNTSVLSLAGFHVLNNTSVVIRPGLVLAGVDDLTFRRRRGGGTDIVKEALTNRPPGATIFLSHSPLHVEEAAEMGVNLMLSGHTHGGQIWPFSYVVRRVYPYFQGRYEINGMTLIVCRGTGTWGPRMRLWRPGEILRITLRAER